MKKIGINETKSKQTFFANDTPIHTPYEPYEGQKLFMEYIINCLDKGANALVQSPTGTGKTMSLLCSTLSWLKNRQQKVKDKSQMSRRIIYTSRTHAQLKQVIEQLVRTGFEVKLSILASRDHTCVNNDLKELKGQSKQLECRLRTIKKNGLFCKYFHHQQYFSQMQSLGEIIDLEDLGMKGKTQGFCPFFYQKSSKNVANLILMPYNYLFDDFGPNHQDISELAKNSILIFDEAHNIPNMCQQSKQHSITLSTLARALQQLQELRQMNLNEKKGKKTNPIQQDQQQKQKLMKSTIQDIQIHASYISLIHVHLQTLAIPNANQENGLIFTTKQLVQCLQNGTKDGQFGSIAKNISKLVTTAACIRGDTLYRPFWAIDSWISFVNKITQVYNSALQKPNQQEDQQCYICQIAYQGSDIKLSFICLDPKAGFLKIKKLNPYSIIMTSGTLSPLNSFPMELETEFDKPLACPHILSNQQVNGCILTHGPNKFKLNFSYENRDNKALYKQLGIILEDIATMTDNGVIVFVPSYKMIEKVKIQLTDNGYLSKIYAKKTIFFQKKNSADFKITLQQYLKESQSMKGALLFALSRGKISEGLDFSDKKCRAVVLVGVPYPPAKDLKVLAKMKYLDKKSQLKKSMNGKQWYICQTIRCINQSIGRIVRHKKDYGALYLLDERFNKSQILGQISSWARSCIKAISDYQDFKFKIEVFRKFNDQKNRDQYEADNFFTSARGTALSNKIKPSSNAMKGSMLSKPSNTPINKQANTPKNVDPNEIMKNLRQKYQAQISQQKNKQEQQKPSRQKIIFGNRKSKKMPIAQLQQCPVCRMQKKLTKNTQCVHELCDDCWDIWLKKDLRCPICRVRVREKYLIKS